LGTTVFGVVMDMTDKLAFREVHET